MNPTSIRFGPAGNSDSFYAAGYKRTADAPAYLQAMGLDALEYSFGRGVRMGQETAQAIREAAQAAGIALSVHLPYFINLAVQEPEKQEKNLQYFRDGLLAARAMGASRAVFHPGSARGDRGKPLPGPAACWRISWRRWTRRACWIPSPYVRRPWVRSTSWAAWRKCFPCAGWTPGSGRRWISATSIAGGWGPSKAGGIMRPSWMPWKLAWAWNGPEFYPLALELAARDYSPVVICESRGTQAEDALALRRMYQAAKNGEK